MIFQYWQYNVECKAQRCFQNVGLESSCLVHEVAICFQNIHHAAGELKVLRTQKLKAHSLLNAFFTSALVKVFIVKIVIKIFHFIQNLS